MKFDLEKALAGERVINGRGQEIKILFVSERKNDYPVCGLTLDCDEADWYTKDGLYDSRNKANAVQDLQMAPKTKKVWIAIKKSLQYQENDWHYSTSAFGSKYQLQASILGLGLKESEVNILELEIEVE